MKNPQFTRVLIKVSGMHLYKIPFQCNIHSKLQTWPKCFYSLLFGQTLSSRAREGQFHLQSLPRAWCWRMRFPRKCSTSQAPSQGHLITSTPHGVGTWEFSTPPAPRFSALVLHKETQGEESHKPRGIHACSSCKLLCFFTATEELSLAPKSVIPHKSLASSHIRAER